MTKPTPNRRRARPSAFVVVFLPGASDCCVELRAVAFLSAVNSSLVVLFPKVEQLHLR